MKDNMDCRQARLVGAHSIAGHLLNIELTSDRRVPSQPSQPSPLLSSSFSLQQSNYLFPRLGPGSGGGIVSHDAIT